MAGVGQVGGVLVDLSRTIHIESTVIPGSIQSLKRLRGNSIPVRFVTNTTKESKKTLVQRLAHIGFDINSEEVFTSLNAARQLVDQRALHPMLLLETDAKKDFEGVECENPDAVVVGLSSGSFNYETLNKAFRLLLQGCPLIAIHKVRYYKRGDGLALGPGPFVSALEYASDVRAEVVGKPQPSFFQQALLDMACSADNAVMIGDDVHSDVDGAQTIGIKGILVQTGKYREGDEDRIQKPPYSVCKDFAEAVEQILSIS